MNMNKMKYLKNLFLLGSVMTLQSCYDDSYKEIESGLLKNPNYETNSFTASVFVENVAQKSVQTDTLGGYLLGQYTQAPFGTKKANILAQVVLPALNPVFGANSQSTEDTNSAQEEETAVEAFLYIPFSNTYAANATYVTDTEYTIDSLYGYSDASFKLSVKELNYFLRDVDPTNELQRQEYFSDFDVSSYLGTSIGTDSTYTISKKSITRYQFDNPTTSTDESGQVADVLAPGIRVKLDPSFFQAKILDKEGADELSNLDTFKNYFRGIAISGVNFSKDLMMLLNLSRARLEVVYTYKSGENTLKSRYDLRLKGIEVNLFENSNETFTINNSDTSSISRIYLSGAEGQHAQIKLFSDAELAELKEKKIMITDASLFLYVDESVSYTKLPDRIYIYNTKTGSILADYRNDPTGSATLQQNSLIVHLGKLSKDSSGAYYYQLRLTNHLINVINNNAENVTLGIVVASNIKDTSVVNYVNESGTKATYPVTAIRTPLGVVLYGNASSIDGDKRLKLKINYSKLN